MSSDIYTRSFLHDPNYLKLSLHDLLKVDEQHKALIEATTEKQLKLTDQKSEGDESLLGKVYCELERELRCFQLNLTLDAQHEQYGSQPQETLRSVLLENKACCSLWNALDAQYHQLLKQCMLESVEDSIRMSASRHLAQEISDWEQRFAAFENDVASRLPKWGPRAASHGGNDHEEISAPRLRDYSTNDLPSCEKFNLVANDRLIINLIKKQKSLDALCMPETLDDITRLNLATLREMTPEYHEFVKDMWELLRLIYIPQVFLPDDAPPSERIRSLVMNSLHCLRMLCRTQILSLSKKSIDSVPEENLFAHLKRFCIIDVDRPQVSTPELYDRLWQLLYWCFRCGSFVSLDQFIDMIDHDPQLEQFPHQHLQLMSSIATLLKAQLSKSAWHHEAQPAYAQPRRFNLSVQERETAMRKYQQLSIELSHLIERNPITILLSFCIQQDFDHNCGQSMTSLISLKELMPDATAEDYLWYNYSLMWNKNDDECVRDLTELQAKILALGPEHFNLRKDNSLAYAKITTLSLSVTTAIDWILRDIPRLGITCVYWLTYLYYVGFCGTANSLTVTHFPHVKRYIGFQSISSAYEIIFGFCVHLSSAIQLCELLPLTQRKKVLTSLMESQSGLLLEDHELLDQIVGKVHDDGACVGGLIFKALITQSCCGDEPDRHEAQNTFTQTVISLFEIAVSSKKCITAIQLAYLIQQDQKALKYVLTALCSKEYYPIKSAPDSRQLQQQKVIEKFYRIFQQRCQDQDDQMSDSLSLFKLVEIAHLVATKIFSCANSHKYKEAWNLILKNNLFPDVDLVSEWKKTALVDLLPQLIEVAVDCLSHADIKYKSDTQVYNESLKQAIVHLRADSSVPSNWLTSAHAKALKNFSD